MLFCGVVRLCVCLCVCLQQAKEAVWSKASVDSCAVVGSERVRRVADGIGVLKRRYVSVEAAGEEGCERLLSEPSQSVSVSRVRDV